MISRLSPFPAPNLNTGQEALGVSCFHADDFFARFKRVVPRKKADVHLESLMSILDQCQIQIINGECLNISLMVVTLFCMTMTGATIR